MSEAVIRSLHDSEKGKLKRFFLRRLRNREDAADATQETFLRLLSLPSLAQIENPQAYLFQVAKSVAYLSGRRRAADAALFLPEAAGAGQAADLPSPERAALARHSLMLMAKRIEALPNRCQQVFILSRLHGLPNGEIARRLGISRNMVEKHIIRALLECRAVRNRLDL